MGRTARSILAALAISLLGVTALWASAQGQPASAESMRTDMRRFLATLGREEQASGQFNSEEYRRFRWNYEGGERGEGLLLGGMRSAQRQVFLEFMAGVLGKVGKKHLDGILALELYRAEQRTNEAPGAAVPADDDFRDPLAYRFGLFGAPSRFGEWTWRFQGRHLSVNFVVRDDRVVATTPAFFGAEPARVDLGADGELRVLGAEEDGGRALVLALDDDLRRRAISSPAALDDIVSGDRWVANPPPTAGIRYRDLREQQQALLWELIELYAARLAPELAATELELIRFAGRDAIRFEWRGSLDVGQPHYYRIHGPTFIIEYSTVDGDPNHVHTAWRDFNRDFGGRASMPVGAGADRER